MAIILQCVPLLFIAGCEPLIRPTPRIGGRWFVETLAMSTALSGQYLYVYATTVLIVLLPLLAGWGWGYRHLGYQTLFTVAFWAGCFMGVVIVFNTGSCHPFSGRSEQSCMRELDHAYLFIVSGAVLTAVHAAWLVGRPARRPDQHHGNQSRISLEARSAGERKNWSVAFMSAGVVAVIVGLLCLFLGVVAEGALMCISGVLLTVMARSLMR